MALIHRAGGDLLRAVGRATLAGALGLLCLVVVLWIASTGAQAAELDAEVSSDIDAEAKLDADSKLDIDDGSDTAEAAQSDGPVSSETNEPRAERAANAANDAPEPPAETANDRVDTAAESVTEPVTATASETSPAAPDAPDPEPELPEVPEAELPEVPPAAGDALEQRAHEATVLAETALSDVREKMEDAVSDDPAPIVGDVLDLATGVVDPAQGDGIRPGAPLIEAVERTGQNRIVDLQGPGPESPAPSPTGDARWRDPPPASAGEGAPPGIHDPIAPPRQAIAKLGGDLAPARGSASAAWGSPVTAGSHTGQDVPGVGADLMGMPPPVPLGSQLPSASQPLSIIAVSLSHPG